MSTHDVVIGVAVAGIVIIIAALLSGLVERRGVPQVLVFLALGAVLGPSGLGIVDIALRSPALFVIATLALVLVLFSDAITLDVAEIRSALRLVLVVLLPGTLVPTALIALLAVWLLHLSVPAAIVLGAALSSTDPVMLRGLLRREDVPAAARLALRLESGMNDVVLLPVVLIGMLFLSGTAPDGHAVGRMVTALFLLGPAAGAVVGYVAIRLLIWVRNRYGVRRDYESIYALGVAFTAYAAAEAVGGSGFLAAFAGGAIISVIDVELCDCFLDYGEASAEMFLLFVFVAFGASLIWSGLRVLDGRTLMFALAAVLARTAVLLPVLRATDLDRSSRKLVAVFGPRGLSSLLLVLLPIFAGLPGSEALFPICCLVVLLSLLLHGGGLMLVASRGVTPAKPPRTAPRSVAAALPLALTADESAAPSAVVGRERITIDELQALQRSGERVLLLDVRKPRAFAESDLEAAGAIRIPPDEAVTRVSQLGVSRNDWLVAYCACPDEATSGRVARTLQHAGWPRARALIGGWDAWLEASLPTEPVAHDDVRPLP